MSSETEIKDKLKYGIAAALSGQFAEDPRRFLEMLAKLLEKAIPHETQVVRTGGLFTMKSVKTVTVAVKGKRYAIEEVGGDTLHAERVKIAQGIALKTESISIELWIAEISPFLTERAKTDRIARNAIARVVKKTSV